MIKYGLLISLVLNALLLMVVAGILPFLLYISIILNATLIWYLIIAIKRSNEIREDTLSIFNSIESFADHLEEIHELETFYGDQDLQNLISHSRSLINSIIDTQEKFYDDIEVVTEQYDEEHDDEEQYDNEEETP